MAETEKYPLQIINAGMFRGGTSSLSLALTELGFGPTWHLITNSNELNQKGSKWWLDNNIFSKLKNEEKVDFDEWLQQIKCKVIMDTPIVFFWDKIFEQYPHCKVIMCVRPFDKWSKSYINMLKQLSDPLMFACKSNDIWTNLLLEQWENHHIGNGYNGMKEISSLNKTKLQNILKEKYYDECIEKAKRIVPKDQLLIFCPSDGWKPLCKFLNVTVPNKPFPNINTMDEYNKFMFEWKINAIKENINGYYIICGIVLFMSVIYWFCIK
eukprot:227665_1